MSGWTESTKKWLVVTCVFAASTCGCLTRRTPAKPVVNSVGPVRPVIPAASKAALETPPDIPVQPLPAAPRLWPSHPQPPKPRVPTSNTPEAAGTGKHTEPTIAPEVPTEELKAAQAETQRSLDSAEKNLALAQGKNLNATQQDIVSKVKGFAESAREAMKNGDWVKAKILSSKAEVLGQQLAESF
jgi:hypothetical protein